MRRRQRPWKGSGPRRGLTWDDPAVERLEVACEARTDDGRVRATLAREGRRLVGSQRLRDARGRLLARGRRRAPPLLRCLAHRRRRVSTPAGPATYSTGNGLEISSLAYYPNNLHPDPAERRGGEHASEEGRRRRREARRRHGRHLRRPRQDEERARTTSASSGRSGRGWSRTPSRRASGSRSRTAR